MKERKKFEVKYDLSDGTEGEQSFWTEEAARKFSKSLLKKATSIHLCDHNGESLEKIK